MTNLFKNVFSFTMALFLNEQKFCNGTLSSEMRRCLDLMPAEPIPTISSAQQSNDGSPATEGLSYGSQRGNDVLHTGTMRRYVSWQPQHIVDLPCQNQGKGLSATNRLKQRKHGENTAPNSRCRSKPDRSFTWVQHFLNGTIQPDSPDLYHNKGGRFAVH